VSWSEIVGADFAARGTPGDAVDGAVPAWVVRPGTVAEARSCVQAVAAARETLVPSGLGAHLDRGAPPAAVGVLLRVDRLAAVVDHQPGDMTVTVQAGCPLGALDRALAPSGQWLPLDPPRPDATTVGGVLAANLSGPLRMSQGTARDLLLGIAVVDATGALVRGGGRVVKNVAGYDLPKLHVGAYGTLGVIVEATFRLRPRPACERAVVLSGTLERAAAAGLAARDLPVPPFWLELAVPGVLADGAALAIGFAGLGEETAAGVAAGTALAAAHGLGARPVEDGAALRARLGGFGTDAPAVLRAATLPTGVAAVLDAAGGRPAVAHLANGVVRVACAGGDVPALVAALRPGLEATGGSLVVERAVADAKRGVDPWGDVGSAHALMRGVKAALDPARTFAPGRFVGGL
jgi:glycolate oxidase FAD binding subunit